MPIQLAAGLLGLLLLAMPAFSQAPAGEPETLLLWPGGAPGAVGTGEEDQPSLTVYRSPAALNTGTAVVICPGGGYVRHAMDHEGRQVAAWFNERGITAFVLKYRLGPRYRHPAPLQDAHRALQYVRLHAEQYGIAPDRIGIMGFSAGGHLASTAATHLHTGDPTTAEPIGRTSARPDFLILGYPVISLSEMYTHQGSRRALLGDDPSPDLVALLSNERRVSPQTPPTFLFHTDADTGVPPENSVAFYLALREAGVPAEMHIYELGRHGVGLAPDDPVLSSWPDRLADWLQVRGLLTR